jgi:Cd2+/Zn2+-exporting ATPase
VVFDKTGTLTESGMSFDGATLYDDMHEDQFLSLAKSVLTHSPHAAAVSFVRQCDAEAGYEVSNVENIGGRGIKCTVNGKTALFGNAKLMSENGIETENYSATCIYGAYGGELVGRLEFSARLKNHITDTVNTLKELGASRIAVVSGDNQSAVRSTCEETGIDEYYAGCTPDEKLDIVSGMRATDKNKFVAFCGDGLNDSAVIAAADVGIAMGGCGSALTVESADVVLMDDNPEKICTAIRISRKTARVANSNIALSLGIKIGVLLVGIALAYLKIDVPIELAIVADVGAAVLAVLNSLRATKVEHY